ncbi:glycoside hydrolase family 43 protein [Aspergillus ruber CBS 135680]|uniref:Putative arabinan-endo 1,5-alpha-L-arabinase n=1 Tax=Aspergillus ruber (strain CBS 135680) TaxID=1388766 RepID=A0A017S234_ASPRC|nr:putative arabinan-endo 1,5-alpha-L-arabinase [Aspergillus ruber CBS 135680]EYE90694.1 putative arabinan-endo 1,5-alpha-L-arabinase [Aspergillus ruber CBS 135680]
MSIRGISLFAASALSVFAAPVRVLNVDFPDPSLIKADDGWYSFATAGNGVQVQVATSSDFKTWELLKGHDAIPGPFPDWTKKEGPEVWAPDVIKRDDGKFVMYFSALTSKDTSAHCIGTATATSIKGPYTPNDKPFVCPLDKGGAIDAVGFQDDDGTRYVIYKTEDAETTIHLQPVKSDGITPNGNTTALLQKEPEDGILVEAPSLVKNEGTYYLTFSSHRFDSPDYDAKYATAKNVAGPYTRQGQILKSGDKTDNGTLTSPGGADFSEDGKKIVFHAHRNGEDVSQGRAMYRADVSLDGGEITIN